MIKEVKIPEIGENVESGEVVNVLVSEGDQVDVDDALIEVETDKAVVEIPSTEKGKVTEISVKTGDTVKPGQVIVKVETEEEGAEEKESEAEEPEIKEKEKRAEEKEEKAEEEETRADEEAKEEEKKKEKKTKEKEKEEPEAEKPEAKDEEEPSEVPELDEVAPASPSVRRFARELGIDINQVTGTGAGGRITEDDVKEYVRDSSGKAATAPADLELPDFSQWGEVKREKMSNVRRITAEGLGSTWATIPHVTQFDEADTTALDAFIDKYSPKVEKQGGKLTITAIIMKIIASALKKFPRFNASIDMGSNELIYKNYIHIGMAVDTERGLLVPVIRDVDKKGILELAVELADIANRTRNKKVKPDELEGGTFTISNQGAIGGTNFTPIVYWPQAAILGISRASIKPVYIDGEFQSRKILPLSLSYDHRINDGADATRFLSWVAQALEHPILLQFEE
ncbi:MAG: biotin/lipoyl-binding protein [candidate division Zixibacteria bacterium]|nr:biotin/lipoyl-binding protein [candidate division Zixibacteria bacterium]